MVRVTTTMAGEGRLLRIIFRSPSPHVETRYLLSHRFENCRWLETHKIITEYYTACPTLSGVTQSLSFLLFSLYIYRKAVEKRKKELVYIFALVFPFVEGKYAPEFSISFHAGVRLARKGIFFAPYDKMVTLSL